MKDILICRCEEVMESEILEVIKNSNIKTSKGVKIKTRAGMGVCQGRTCRPLIDHVVSAHTNTKVPESSSLTQNNPVRPISLFDLSSNRKENDYENS